MSADIFPRLKLAEVDPKLAALLGPTVERLGYFGEFFQVTAHAPDALVKFMEYTAALKAYLPDNLNEVAALTVCSRLGADYERIQHERLALRLGFSRDWIAELTGRRGEPPSVLNIEERSVRDLAQAILGGNPRTIEAEIGRSADQLGPQKSVAAFLQITRFQTIAVICKAFRLSLPVPSIFEADKP